MPIMAKTRSVATLTPHFRDFLPLWVSRQPWYLGTGIPSLSPVGFIRFEDPAGEVGIETHLVTDGSAIYQIPMTYRGAPIENAVPGAERALIATAEHSVLGTRWIYDGEADPVWVSEVLRLVRTNGTSEPGHEKGVREAYAQGHQVMLDELTGDAVTIELRRVLTVDHPAGEPDIVGLMTGTWYPNGPDAAVATGCLAVVRKSG
ncbi:maltokinase N-terminal cap-like domain-containing protein [Microtetraspora malaysiensis]|uniref:maltokinase N-terminal cap-like domain-containing protein n=1 Tax=Microtetraspora malaysiensis TaxID=161358 RepID=UPI003D8F303C